MLLLWKTNEEPINRIHYILVLIHHSNLHAPWVGFFVILYFNMALIKGGFYFLFFQCKSLQSRVSAVLAFAPLTLRWHWHDIQIMLNEWGTIQNPVGEQSQGRPPLRIYLNSCLVRYNGRFWREKPKDLICFLKNWLDPHCKDSLPPW